LNAVNLEISQELTQIWKDFDKDDELRVAGLTGKGREEIWHQHPWRSAAASDRRINPPANPRSTCQRRRDEPELGPELRKYG